MKEEFLSSKTLTNILVRESEEIQKVKINIQYFVHPEVLIAAPGLFSYPSSQTFYDVFVCGRVAGSILRDMDLT